VAGRRSPQNALLFPPPRRREVVRRGKSVLKAPLLRQHADYVDPWTFADFIGSLSDLDFDVMLEAKAKDLALFRLRTSRPPERETYDL